MQKTPLAFLSSATLLALLTLLTLNPGKGQTPASSQAQSPAKQLYVLEDSYLRWPLQPSEQAYGAIDGKHLRTYVDDQTAISRRYRDAGHQFWGRISGTEADAENAKWLLTNFRKIGLSDVHEQSFDMPPQWMPQSWSVSASSGPKTFKLETAQPTYLSAGTPSGGLNLEAVDVHLASEGDLKGLDLRGKAVFFYSTDTMSRHATISQGAIKRIADRGAAAIFVTLLIPGNLKFQFYPVGVPTPTHSTGSQIPTFALGYDDGMAMREMIGQARGGDAPRVKVRLDVKMVPNLKTATIWGSLPGTIDENIMIVAHRDAWFEGADDNGTGVATLLGLAEYFAKIPKEQRRRTINFLGTSGHHDNSLLSGRWLTDHKEIFSKTALLINSEHTAGELLISANGVIRRSNEATPLNWYVGGSPKLEQIVVKAYDTFGVSTYSEAGRTPGGEIGPNPADIDNRYFEYAPSLQVMDTTLLYWHSDKETSEYIPPTELEAVTRAFAKIIADVNKLDLKDLEKPAQVSR